MDRCGALGWFPAIVLFVLDFCSIRSTQSSHNGGVSVSQRISTLLSVGCRDVGELVAVRPINRMRLIGRMRKGTPKTADCSEGQTCVEEASLTRQYTISSIPMKRQTRWNSPATVGKFVAVAYYVEDGALSNRCSLGA